MGLTPPNLFAKLNMLLVTSYRRHAPFLPDSWTSCIWWLVTGPLSIFHLLSVAACWACIFYRYATAAHARVCSPNNHTLGLAQRLSICLFGIPRGPSVEPSTSPAPAFSFSRVAAPSIWPVVAPAIGPVAVAATALVDVPLRPLAAPSVPALGGSSTLLKI